MSEFYVLLHSEASKDVCVGNTSTSFTNMMPNNMQLHDGWKIALQSISLDTSFSNNVPKEVSWANHHIVYCNQAGTPSTSITIPKNNYTRETLYAFLLNELRLKTNNKIVIPKIMPNGKLEITIKKCRLWINEEVCKWLRIRTEGFGIQRIETTGLDWMLQKKNTNYANRDKFFEFAPDVFFSSESKVIFDVETIPTILPKMIKIQLGEMKLSLSSSGNHQDLAIIPFDRPQNYINFYREVTQKEYFHLNSNLIQTLSIKLTDEKGDELQLISPRPTFVKLKFKNMSSSSFLLRLSSSDSTNIYTDNTAESFRIQLPRLTSLTGQNWQVALSSIIYPSQISVKDYLADQELWIELVMKDAWGQWFRRHKIDLKNEAIENNEHLQFLINTQARARRYGNNFEITIDRITKMANFKCVGELIVRMSPTMTSILGSNTCEIIANNEKKKQIGIVDINRCMPSNLLLYSDFTSPIIVGGKYHKLLKFIPILENFQLADGSVSSYVSYESHHMDFVDVPTTDLESLQFDLRDAAGKKLTFTNKNVATIVNLLFRKK
jgi:hypothetical protein